MYDFPAMVKASRRFYKSHDLTTWARAISRQPRPVGDVESLLEHAERSGFVEGFVFPPVALQAEMLTAIVDACARQPSPLLADNQQYREPFLADDWTRTANGRVLQRDHSLGVRESGPYALLYSTSPFANCWGKTGKQITEQFAARDWNGLTVYEYLVLQRVRAERFGDHRFYDEPSEDPTAHWLWLLDSRNETDCAVALGNSRGVNLQAASLGNRESKRNAIAAVLIPLAGPAD